MLVAWGLKCRKDGEMCVVLPYYAVSLLVYIVVVALAALFSVDRVASAFGEYGRYEGLAIILGYLVVAILPQALLGKRDVELLLAIWMVISIAISAYALLQGVGIDFKIWKATFVGERVFSTLGNPLYLSAYLVLTIPAAIGLYLTRRSRLAILAIALGIPALIITYSRSGWLALIAALVLFPPLMLGNSDSKPSFSLLRRRAVAVTAVILSMIIASSALAPKLGERVRSAFDRGAGSVAARFYLWKLTAMMISERPILGYGPETFLEVSSARLDLNQQRAERNTQYDRPHSDLLQVAFNSGILGFLAYAYFLIRYFSGIARRGEDPERTTMITGLFAGVLGYLIAVQFFFSSLAVSPVMWLVMAMTGILVRGERKVNVRFPPTVGYGAAMVAIVVIALPQLAHLAADVMLQRSISDESSGNIKGAYESADLSARIDPWHIEYGIRKGEVLEKLGDLDGAIMAYTRATKVRPLRYEPYAGLAAVAYERKDFERAIDMSLEALKRYPLHYESRLIYAVSSAFEGDFREAEENLLLLQRIDPHDYRAF